MLRHRDMAGTDVLRTRGTENLVAAALATGARRFVAESMMFGYGYGDHGERPLEEDVDRFGPPGADRHLEEHVGAMRRKEELTFTPEGLDGVSLRFGLFYGAGVTDTTVLPMLRKRALPVVADHGRALSWVEVGDAARALVAAVETGRPGRAYNVCDDEPLSWGDHVRTAAQAFGAPAPRTVPLWLLRPAPLARTLMTTGLRMSNARARGELGWTPTHRGTADGLKALAAGTAPLPR
jgi:nucleoside-diphosphate-sugar epimerase